MNKISLPILIALIIASNCFANICGGSSGCSAAKSDKEETKSKRSEKKPKSKLDEVLQKLKKQNRQLKTYQADIKYIFTDAFDIKSTRTGKIYYKKTDEASMLKIRFDTYQLDDGDKEKRREEYYFDGIWLKKVDYLNQTINSYQKAEKDKPVNAFEMISRDFPIIGFTKKDDLRKNFDIKLLPNKEDKDIIELKLEVKKDSVYSDKYKEIDFMIDKKRFLPARLITESTEGDTYDIRLFDSKINKKIKDGVFKLETPDNFKENIHPLNK